MGPTHFQNLSILILANWAMKTAPGCLGYVGIIVNQFEDPGSLLNNQYFMESKRFFFVAQPMFENPANKTIGQPNSCYFFSSNGKCLHFGDSTHLAGPCFPRNHDYMGRRELCGDSTKTSKTINQPTYTNPLVLNFGGTAQIFLKNQMKNLLHFFQLNMCFFLNVKIMKCSGSQP